jgi:peptide deformylase
VPGVFDEVRRAYEVEIKALDDAGKPLELKAEGYLARAIQHEIDHLNGVLFVDRLGVLRRTAHRKELKALERGARSVGGPKHEGPAL